MHILSRIDYGYYIFSEWYNYRIITIICIAYVRTYIQQSLMLLLCSVVYPGGLNEQLMVKNLTRHDYVLHVTIV